jgi:hypothetical protein
MFELTDLELQALVKVAREAKTRGYSSFTATFFPHQLSNLTLELATPREDLLKLYRTSC